jgi:small subunit ribosomal protein S6
MKDFFYETMYILRPDLTEEQVEQSVTKYQAQITENGGDLLDTQHRGKRRLAYPILKHKEGIYVQMNFKGCGDQIAPMERSMRLSEEVLRFLTIKQEVREVAAATATVEAE